MNFLAAHCSLLRGSLRLPQVFEIGLTIPATDDLQMKLEVLRKRGFDHSQQPTPPQFPLGTTEPVLSPDIADCRTGRFAGLKNRSGPLLQ